MQGTWSRSAVGRCAGIEVWGGASVNRSPAFIDSEAPPILVTVLSSSEALSSSGGCSTQQLFPGGWVKVRMVFTPMMNSSQFRDTERLKVGQRQERPTHEIFPSHVLGGRSSHADRMETPGQHKKARSRSRLTANWESILKRLFLCLWNASQRELFLGMGRSVKSRLCGLAWFPERQLLRQGFLCRFVRRSQETLRGSVELTLRKGKARDRHHCAAHSGFFELPASGSLEGWAAAPLSKEAGPSQHPPSVGAGSPLSC